MNEESTLYDAVFNRDLEETVQKAKKNIEEMEQHLEILRDLYKLGKPDENIYTKLLSDSLPAD